MKKSFRFIIRIDELKTVDGKIKANQVQYDLDREAAKISGLSSGKLEIYKYLTGEDLGYKHRSSWKSSPFGKVFNKGLD